MNRYIEKILKGNSKLYINYLRKNGCKIGNYTHLHDPKSFYIDKNRLKYIEIGDNVQITRNVTILAHDFSYSVLLHTHNVLPQKVGVTKIGNNVFIGMNSIILMGSNIGNNVIIGAGSVVSGKFPDNCVIAGNPARIICSIEDYYNKCSNKMEKDLFYLCEYYIEKYNCFPPFDDILYCNLLFRESYDEIKNNCEKFIFPSTNKSKFSKLINNNMPKYNNINEFYNIYKEKISEKK